MMLNFFPWFTERHPSDLPTGLQVTAGLRHRFFCSLLQQYKGKLCGRDRLDTTGLSRSIFRYVVFTVMGVGTVEGIIFHVFHQASKR